MDDPKLKRTSVTVKYSADDGYSSDAGFKGTPERRRTPVRENEDVSARVCAASLHGVRTREATDGQRRSEGLPAPRT